MRRNHVFNLFQKMMIYCKVFVLNPCVYESLISMNFLVKDKLTFTLIQLNFNQPVPNTSEAYFLCKNASFKIQHQVLLTSFFGGYLPVVVALPITLRAIAAILLLRLSSITPSLLRVTALWSPYSFLPLKLSEKHQDLQPRSLQVSNRGWYFPIFRS